MPSTSPSGGQRHRAHRAERLRRRRPPRRVGVGAVVVDVHRPARSGPPSSRCPCRAAGGSRRGRRTARRRPGTRGPVPPSVVLEQVQEAVLDADQARGAVDDLAQQLARLEALEQAERHLVDRREVRVAGRVVHAQPEAVGAAWRGTAPGRRPRPGRPSPARRPGRAPTPALTVTVGPVVLGQPHDRGPDPLGRPRGIGAARDARQQDGELVAAVAVDAVAVAQRAGHRGRDPRQQRVALGVAVPVVVGLERVEVEHQQAERLLAGDRAARARAGTRRGCAGRSARRARPGSSRRRAPRRCAARSTPGPRTAARARTRPG